ncbi:MAG: ISNCY family transposase [Candidatus Eisenbacteria bacterium]
MRVKDVILRAMSGELTWIRAAEILGISDRSMRRWRWRMEKYGYEGLLDRRRHVPSPRRVPVKVLEQVLRLYRTRYQGFNVRHFHSILKREHKFEHSYTLVRMALQEAGLVRKKRARGPHRLRREPRASFGEMLHLDGSDHAWLALRPETRQCMMVVVDDATSQLLYAQLVEHEDGHSAMSALYSVISTHGLPMALYTDRASWAVYTARKGEAPEPGHLTQVGRALRRLGIEHILGYSPQARGRSERANGTLQGRLVNELRVARISTLEAANRYLRQRFIPIYNEEFGRKPTDPANAFVPVGRVDVDQILCHEEERTVSRDNAVSFEGKRLQIRKQAGLRTCAGREVVVRRHLDDSHSVWMGECCLGRSDRLGRAKEAETRSLEAGKCLASAAA